MTDPTSPSLEELLIASRERLARLVRRRGSGLLRFESVSDLVQGVHAHAFAVADRFEYQGEPQFQGWLAKVARQFIAKRHEYWSARKRDAGQLLRITAAGSSAATRPDGVQPAANATGPATFAARREQLELAMRAIELLLPRDRDLVQWMSEGLTIAEMAERLDISQAAAERARLRAIERFRKAFTLLERRG